MELNKNHREALLNELSKAKEMHNELVTYCELYWWNMGKKTLSFKGTLENLLKEQKIEFYVRKTDIEGIYTFKFKSAYKISFENRGLKTDFPHLAKQFLQMELVRMGDKASLYVEKAWRPLVTVNH